MNKLGLFFLIGVMTLSLQAQESFEHASVQFAKTIDAHDMKAHLSFLADDLMEGRETGTRGQQLAARYIRTHFMRLGLLPGNIKTDSYFQYYYLNRSSVHAASIKLNKKTFEYGKDFFNYRSSLPQDLNGEFVFGGYGISSDTYDNLSELAVKDKIVLLLSGSPNEEEIDRWDIMKEWTSRTEELEKRGAKAMIMILPEDMTRTMKRYARRSSFQISDKPEPGMPAIYLTPEMGKQFLTIVKAKQEKLEEALAKSAKPETLKFDKLDFSLAAETEWNSVPAENVMGLLEGTDKKDELIILTAHYDHIGTKDGVVNNGADDDGSGTVGILELAEAFAKAAEEGNRPRRSILFMTVSGEEKGLLGSAFYADHPIYPIENTVANLNIDMIGRIDPKYAAREDSANYIYVIGSDKLSTDLHNIGEAANDEFTQLTLDYKYNDEKDPNRFYYRSDHYNFAKKGIPIIFYFNGTHADYHQPTDDVEKIHFEKAAKVTRLVFHTAWELANREERIVVDKEVEQR